MQRAEKEPHRQETGEGRLSGEGSRGGTVRSRATPSPLGALSSPEKGAFSSRHIIPPVRKLSYYIDFVRPEHVTATCWKMSQEINDSILVLLGTSFPRCVTVSRLQPAQLYVAASSSQWRVKAMNAKDVGHFQKTGEEKHSLKKSYRPAFPEYYFGLKVLLYKHIFIWYFKQ